MRATTANALLLALAAVVSAVLAVHGLRHRHARGALAFAAFMGGQALFTLCQAVVLVTGDPGVRMFFGQLRFVGLVTSVLLVFTNSWHVSRQISLSPSRRCVLSGEKAPL